MNTENAYLTYKLYTLHVISLQHANVELVNLLCVEIEIYEAERDFNSAHCR